MRDSMKVYRHLLILLALLSSPVAADTPGEQHNKFVLCLLATGQTDNANVSTLLTLAVRRCGMDANVLAIRQTLVENAPESCSRPGSVDPSIEEIANDRRYGLKQRQLQWLFQMERIVSNQSSGPDAIINNLKRLHQTASRALKPDDRMDAAILMGLLIFYAIVSILFSFLCSILKFKIS